MSKDKLSELEIRYEKFYQDLSDQQQHDSTYLVQKSIEIESSDLPLAFRIMQRVKGLVEGDSANNRIELLREKMNESHPEYMKASSNEKNSSEKYLSPITEELKTRMRSINPARLASKLRSTFALIFIPLFIFAFYQIIWASDRYESKAQLIVKEPDSLSTLDPSMALIAGLGGSTGSSDTELVKAYIHSNDMLQYLQSRLNLQKHYSNSNLDVFSRLSGNASREATLEYFIGKVEIEIDEKSGVISVFSQAFSPEFAQALTANITERAEWFINEIGHKLASEQLKFVQKEHLLTEKRLHKAKARLLTFQREYNLLDPEAEGMALQQITYGLEAQIASKQAELRTLKNSMSTDAPPVLNVNSQLNSLQAQLEMQRSKLTQKNKSKSSVEGGGESVGEILAIFTDYKIDLEFALQAYSASKVSLEKSRIEAYRQIKYLITVDSPMLPQEAKYPDAPYNIGLFFVLQLMFIGIFKILIATVNELR